MKTFRNLLLMLWFGWFAMAGVIITGLLVWLTPWSMSGWGILLAGSVGGILMGAVFAAVLLYTLWRRIGAPLMGSLALLRMLRQKLFQFNAGYRV